MLSEKSNDRILRGEELKSRRQLRLMSLRLLAVLAIFIALVLTTISTYSTRGAHDCKLKDIQQCAINDFHLNLSFLDAAKPIPTSEFITRRDNLARALVKDGVDAFVVEPGYTSQYYFNLSQRDWELWEPEERPMLMIVQPYMNDVGETTASTSILAPSFEVGRVRMLGIPGFESEAIDVLGWEEHWNPYATLRDNRIFGGFTEAPKLMMDEEIRDYIVRGLDRNGFETIGLAGESEAVRQAKSHNEVELLRAVNTGTVEAVRAVRKCLVPDVTEDEVTQILDNTMASIGFEPFFDIVLFEEDGALPHGGFVTGGKVLTHETMVVIDVGAHYLGYSSDICRSFFIDRPSSPTLFSKLIAVIWPPSSFGATSSPQNSDLHAEKLKVWDIVLEAQTESAKMFKPNNSAATNQPKMFKPNNSAASVDIAARKVISEAGYAETFTHRVGHGIGIKAHESPYLNKVNHDVLLRPGMTFTSEPGIYILNKFGVRHEDIFLVKENGETEVLTGRRAIGPWEP